MAGAYERHGDGPHTVLVLHGWFGAASTWGALRPHLDGEEFSYVFANYRGYGGRQDVAGEYSIAESARDVLAVADELGVGSFSVVGHSMGGSVMQRVFADAPDRVRSLVGISPVPASGVPFDDETWGLFSGAADDPAHRRAIVDFTTGNRLTGVWLDAMVSQSARNSTPEAVAGHLRAWAKTDFHTEIADSEVPIKVIVGEHDPALGEDTIRATFGQWYPKLELEVMANAGHYAPDETPVALATSIESFLRER
ncbi:alpha/beta fold hydrolase [Allosaccharopolyspora coralli]|uniref:Alpha/beta fold hydrolase n=1 Tax=Allosaccharopolyspora coralli TaxID=2665642 RepID=A0A5Q3QCY2_9PSEU|nr:alpha/beta hydrolase [Allosaccharopolyspora coralli]QGK69345.1 alpha/beta fold hydrolase [Allosaccharopolyspora coralli]